jgi:hypothetical protein
VTTFVLAPSTDDAEALLMLLANTLGVGSAEELVRR